jgi:heme/copper-type cytochrome/quinol oxidase subunit 3
MSGPSPFLDLPPSDPRMLVLRHLRPPAFLLLCVGLLNITFCFALAAVLAFKLRMPWAVAGAGAPPTDTGPTLPVMVVLALALLWSGITVWGSLHAMRLGRYGPAILSAVAAMVPPSITCFVGLPIGIWMLVVLNRPGVKSAFSGK